MLDDSNKPLPLAGIRVLDIASLYAAPLAATILADFGAEVIKIEPPGGDGFRNTGMWPVVARNKKSITLDLRKSEGCETLKQLVERSDVLIENYPPATLERRGIAWKDLHARNRDLVMVSVSCFGQDGPNAGRPGSGTIGEAYGGLVHMVGPAEDAPLLPSFPLGDALGAMNTAIGTMMALYWRDGGRARPVPGAHHGRGQHVDATLYEPVLFAISQVMAQWKPGQSPRRSGSRLKSSVIRNVYRTSDDQFVAISASTERHVVDLVKLAGGTEQDANIRDADAIVARWIATVGLDDLMTRLVAARIPIAPVNDIETLLADPHIRARRNIQRIDDPDLGALALLRPTPTLSETPGSIRSVGPKLAEHNEEVYRTLLGLGEARLRALRDQQVI